MSGLDHTTPSPGGVHLDFEIGRGLAALVGGDGPLRSEVLEGLARKLARGDDRMTILIAGFGVATPTLAWRRAVRVLAQWSGLDGVEREVNALLPKLSQGVVTPTSTDSEIAKLRARVQELRPLPEAVRMKDAELRGLRADAAEVLGDMEEANMEWLRARQDAETHLLAYRDRARELKLRLQELESGGLETACPTCERVLDDRFESVLAVLREEWESVVQDGSWWKRRKEQLDEKPPRLRELEGESVRLHAASEECTEEAERLRTRLPELAEVEDMLAATQANLLSVDDAAESAASPGGRSQRRRRALEVLREELLADARGALTATTGRYLNHLTSGVALGVGLTGDGEPTVVRDEGARRLQSDEEVAAYMFALRLALIDLAHGCEVRFGEVLLDDTFDRLEPEAKVRAVGLLRSFLPTVPKILLFCRGDILDAIPESFDWIVELDVEQSGNALARARKSGVGKLRIH